MNSLPQFVTVVFELAPDNLPEQVEELAAIMREAAEQCEMTLRSETHTFAAPTLFDMLGIDLGGNNANGGGASNGATSAQYLEASA